MAYMQERAEGSTTARKYYIQPLIHHTSTDVLTLVAVNTFTPPATPEIVMFCGSPGSGKSSFYWKHLQPFGYGRVNQDILKTVSC